MDGDLPLLRIESAAELLDLDPEIDARCIERLRLADTHQAAGCYHWIEAGKCHAENKADLGSRKWAPWCREHDVSVDTADVLIRVAERFDPILVTVTRMEPLPIDLRALITLSSPSVPPAAAETAVAEAAAGEHITKAKAEEMIAAAKAAERDAIEGEIAELSDQIDELTKNIGGRVDRALEPMRKKIAALEKQRDAAKESLAKARKKLAEKPKTKAKPKADEPQLPAIDGTVSFRAMCILQALASLQGELKITAKECVAIQFEVSERLTGESPATKLAPAATQARAIATWCQEFIVEVEARKGGGNA